MILRPVTGRGPQWARAQAFITANHSVPDYRISPARHRLWALEETEGGTFDEVTEEITGRELGGVLVCSRDSYMSEDTLVLVRPDHREQRWGYKMLRYLLENITESAYGRVNVQDGAGMAFAAKYGNIQSVVREGGSYVALVHFTYQNRNWRHGGCRCHYCTEELSSLTGGRNVRSYEDE